MITSIFLCLCLCIYLLLLVDGSVWKSILLLMCVCVCVCETKCALCQRQLHHIQTDQNVRHMSYYLHSVLHNLIIHQ